MIWTYILQAIVIVLNVVFDTILFKVNALPFGIDSVLSEAFANWYGFLNLVWWAQLPWKLTIDYINIEILLMVLRLIRIIR